jgi:hypothetical protein
MGLAKTYVGRVVVAEEEGGQETNQQEDELNDNDTFHAASDLYTYEDIKKKVKLFFKEAVPRNTSPKNGWARSCILQLPKKKRLPCPFASGW